MIYRAPSCSFIVSTIRRSHRLLLGIPLCVLVIGCDSASSNTNKEVSTKVAPVNNAADSSPSTVDLADSLSKSKADADELDAVEGRSLIMAAQSTADSSIDTVDRDGDTANYSSLQATLIGDYGGMLPCSFCDSIDITLNLFADGSVLKTSLYKNPSQPKVPTIESGIYRQDNDLITIVYEQENIETYRIQDNHLILMDNDKQLDDDYVLSRK